MHTDYLEKHEEFEEEGEEAMSLPPRRTLFPSNKIKLIRRFYHLLVILFIALTIGLILWGTKLLETVPSE